MGMTTQEFFGGWQMRVALVCALFLLSVECLILNEPTNRLDMDAVLWLED
jgi:ATPase subunit of ABC transporter with duplicated ATPase domains